MVEISFTVTYYNLEHLFYFYDSCYDVILLWIDTKNAGVVTMFFRKRTRLSLTKIEKSIVYVLNGIKAFTVFVGGILFVRSLAWDFFYSKIIGLTTGISLLTIFVVKYYILYEINRSNDNE